MAPLSESNDRDDEPSTVTKPTPRGGRRAATKAKDDDDVVATSQAAVVAVVAPPAAAAAAPIATTATTSIDVVAKPAVIETGAHVAAASDGVAAAAAASNAVAVAAAPAPAAAAAAAAPVAAAAAAPATATPDTAIVIPRQVYEDAVTNFAAFGIGNDPKVSAMRVLYELGKADRHCSEMPGCVAFALPHGIHECMQLWSHARLAAAKKAELTQDAIASLGFEWSGDDSKAALLNEMPPANLCKLSELVEGKGDMSYSAIAVYTNNARILMRFVPLDTHTTV